RTSSAAASALVVAGPSRSRRARTMPCETGKVFSARSLRTSCPSTIRSSLAERPASASWVTPEPYRISTAKLLTLTEELDARYKWIALSNPTLGVMLATIDASIVLVAMPSIFRGIHLDPLQPGNSFYLLWMILGFLVVSSVLVVSLGRLGDIYGRVRMYT